MSNEIQKVDLYDETKTNILIPKVTLEQLNDVNIEEKTTNKKYLLKFDGTNWTNSDMPTTLSEYGITDAYTKTEIDSKIASVFKYKGSVSTTSDLPVSGQSVGDVYNVQTADSTKTIVSEVVKSGDNVCWTGSAWDVLSGTVDISGKADKTYVDTELAKKQDTITSSNKLAASLVDDLATVATSGSYNDLDATTLPTIGNAILTIQKNNIDVGTFNANATADETINIEVPVKTSDLENDNEFITKDVDNLTNYTKNSNLATVATSGSYNDLNNKITAATVDVLGLVKPDGTTIIIDNDGTITALGGGGGGGSVSVIQMNGNNYVPSSGVVNLGTVITSHQSLTNYYTKNELATVATSGSYSDLDNKPTNVSEFTNDAGYITNDSISSYITSNGLSANNKKITNISSGSLDTDGVNYSQIKVAYNDASYSDNKLTLTSIDGSTKELEIKSGSEGKVYTSGNGISISSEDVISVAINEDNLKFTDSKLDLNFSNKQTSALNSGITSDLVTKISTNENNITTINNSSVMTSGIDSTKVGQITTNDTNINTLQGYFTDGKANIALNANNASNADNATFATTASKLGSTNVGSVTKPIYLDAGTATACTYSLNKDVPSDALFTDTIYTHPDSGVTAGTYRSVTVDAQGHVTDGTNPITLAGYGITDAKIDDDGTITLGDNTITPLTEHQSLANYSTLADTVKSLSISDKTITVTPGGGSTYTLTTQDTTYTDGIGITISTDDNNKINISTKTDNTYTMKGNVDLKEEPEESSEENTQTWLPLKDNTKNDVYYVVEDKLFYYWSLDTTSGNVDDWKTLSFLNEPSSNKKFTEIDLEQNLFARYA